MQEKNNELDINDLKLIYSVLRKFPLEEIETTYNKVIKLIQEKNGGAKD